MGNYDDIINMKRPASKRPKMSIRDRCFQFAPFAAVAGHKEATAESARITEDEITFSEDLKIIIDKKIRIIIDNIEKQPLIFVKFFIPDSKKDGGRYECFQKKLIKFDPYKNIFIFEDKTYLNIKNIIDIKSDIIADEYFDVY